MGRKNTFRIIEYFTPLFLLASCGPSGHEVKIIESCKRSASTIDAYDEDGTHYSKTDFGSVVIRRVCEAKAELYVEGYRITRDFYPNDIDIFRVSLVSDESLTSIYKEAIETGASP